MGAPSIDPSADASSGRAAIDAWLRRVGAAGMLPPRLADGAAPSGRPRFRGEVRLTAAAHLVLAEADGIALVAPVVLDGDDVRRAVPGDGAFMALADVLRAGERRGPLVASPVGSMPPATGERAIDVDQSNDSVIVGGDVVLKLFPRPGAGPQPGEELAAHLAAVGSADVPTPFGSLRWELPGEPSLLVATSSRYLPGARDGWAWFLDLAVVGIAGDDRGPSITAAERCGALVARLHVALATPSAVLAPTPVGTAEADAGDRWRERGEALLAEAVELTSGPEGERLRALAPRIREAFAAFPAADGTPVQRIHGDLHVGQILAWDGGHAIADLDGNPLAPASERLEPQPTARDVASFVRSLDHLGRIAQRRLPADPERVDAWIRDVRGRFLSAYADEISGGGRSRFDDRLVRPFEVVQACHEFVYATRFLPAWLPIADLAIGPLLEDAAP